jgi:hypothetical protein
MPPCDRCAGDAHLRSVDFDLVTREGQRFAIRGDLTYKIPPACGRHSPNNQRRTDAQDPNALRS